MTDTPVRIGIVGAGHVGATTAYALLLSGVAAELVLIDEDRRRANGEAMDLNHAAPFARPTRIWAGDYADLHGALVTIVAAGVGQRPGETRLDLLHRNAQVFRTSSRRLSRVTPTASCSSPPILSTCSVTSPGKLSGRPAHQMIGSGTILDTARFRHPPGAALPASTPERPRLHGVVSVVRLPLSDGEAARLHQSAAVLTASIRQLPGAVP